MSSKQKVFLIWLTGMTLFIVTASALATYHWLKGNATDRLFKAAIP
jgi:hypothetical protein